MRAGKGNETLSGTLFVFQKGKIKTKQLWKNLKVIAGWNCKGESVQ